MAEERRQEERRDKDRRTEDRRSDHFEHVTFPKDAVLLQEGEKGDAAYIIIDGKVEIRKGRLSGNPQTLATRTRGEVIGELALFDDKPHMASAVAVEETVVNAMSRDEFHDRLEDMDPAMRGIVKLMVQRVREMADDLMESGTEVNWADWRRKR